MLLLHTSTALSAWSREARLSQPSRPLHFVPTKGDILVLFGTKDEVTRFTGETS